MLSALDERFLDFAEEYLEILLRERGHSSVDAFADIESRPPFAVPPVVIANFKSISRVEIDRIISDYKRLGVAHFVVANHDERASAGYAHQLFEICAQLREELNLGSPLTHPLEGHPEAVTRFGAADGTAKIYDLPKPVGGSSYREVAETSEAFEVHLDGLGSGGTVQTVVLYMDSAPLFGGFTFFYDLPALAAALSLEDMEAFKSLFLPDAFTAVRPRGKGAIKVTSPVLYIGESGKVQAFFRKDSGEYVMEWRADHEPLLRARDFLHRHTTPFAGGSFFVPMMRPGSGCFSRNGDIAHGRTAFVDGTTPSQRRVLSRKWFMTSETHGSYKHVPGIALRADIAALSPERFGGEYLQGEWLYDRLRDVNDRIK